ncbi:MAG: DUF3299 domain-containing protein [Verrucomicrobia bacterium]|nr:DUF3299 domain-containing protein [Verrucomicrobiota bacterium]
MLASLTFVAAAPLRAAPFKGPSADHSVCCGRGFNPLVHGSGEFASDPLVTTMPGLEIGADSAAPRPQRRMPAALPSTISKPAAAAPAAPNPGPPLAALEGPLETISGYAKVAFSQLAGFKFRPPAQPLAAGQAAPDVLTQVPAPIRRLDGKKVVLTGYMLPLKLEGGLATEFFFLSSPTLCCYGIVPEVNEWMHVRMKKEGLPPVQDVPMFLAGRLHVRARWDDGYLTGIYELEGDGLLKPR